MKRTTRRTGRQLALMLRREPQAAWPPDADEALIATLADLLLEALGREEAPRAAEDHDDEPEDHR